MVELHTVLTVGFLGMCLAVVNENVEKPKRRLVERLGLLPWLVLWPLGLLVRLWGWSLRFKFRSEQEARWIGDQSVPMLVVLWHNRLFLASEIHRRYRKQRKIFGMVSASRDGAMLASFFKMLGIQSIRGSRHFRGAEALRSMLAELKAGHDVAVTPDGSRGPCYEMKPGGLLLARTARSPVLLISSKFGRAWRLKSWDQFFLPMPFSCVELRCELIHDLKSVGIKDAKESGCSALKSRLDGLTEDELGLGVVSKNF